MARPPRFPLTRKRRLLIVGCSMSLLLVLMFVSVEPEVQYSIDEVMDDPTAYEGELHVRGEVSIGSLETDNFSFSISEETPERKEENNFSRNADKNFPLSVGKKRLFITSA